MKEGVRQEQAESSSARAVVLWPQVPGKAAAEALREADLQASRPCIPACHDASPGPEHPPRYETRVVKALRLLRHRSASGIRNTPGARFSHADSRC